MGPLFLSELLRVKSGFTQSEIDESANARLTKTNKESQAEVAFSGIFSFYINYKIGLFKINLIYRNSTLVGVFGFGN